MVLAVGPGLVSSRTTSPGLDVIFVEARAVDDVVGFLDCLVCCKRTLGKIAIHHEVFNFLKDNINGGSGVIGHVNGVFSKELSCAGENLL